MMYTCKTSNEGSAVARPGKGYHTSCAFGRFIRLFDGCFSLHDMHETEVHFRIEGIDGNVPQGQSLMREISRDPEDLVARLYQAPP